MKYITTLLIRFSIYFAVFFASYIIFLLNFDYYLPSGDLTNLFLPLIVYFILGISLFFKSPIKVLGRVFPYFIYYIIIINIVVGLDYGFPNEIVISDGKIFSPPDNWWFRLLHNLKAMIDDRSIIAFLLAIMFGPIGIYMMFNSNKKNDKQGS